jgi:opine dehydrogenase
VSRVAIVGAGAVARGMAALLARDGHVVGLWSPSGASAADWPAASVAIAWPGWNVRSAALHYTGTEIGVANVALLPNADAIAVADSVLIALPGPGYATVLPRVAGRLRDAQIVLFSGALSLAPLWLAELAMAHGLRPTIASLGTTIVTARRDGPGVRIMALRSRLDVGAIPASAGARTLAVCMQLFGDRFALAPNALAIALSNINPEAHAALALANLTRMERGEAWPQYHYMTPAVARLIEAMDRERRTIAGAFGLRVRSIEEHFHHSFDVPLVSLADIAAELHRRRGGPPGPTSLESRFVLEDVPFGLVFYEVLAQCVNVPVPAMSAAITVLSSIYGRDFRRDNPVLAALRLEGADRAALLARCESSGGRAV